MKARSQFSSTPTKHSRKSGQEKIAAVDEGGRLTPSSRKLPIHEVRAKMAYFGVHVPKSAWYFCTSAAPIRQAHREGSPACAATVDDGHS